jgi:hypothetical protein
MSTFLISGRAFPLIFLKMNDFAQSNDIPGGSGCKGTHTKLSSSFANVNHLQ